MDDHRLIKDDNGLVQGSFTPLNIWFQTDFTLSAVAWWMQWHAWGEHPGFYHAVNILLHGLSAILLWRLLKRLKIPGAWFAAALFAVHPVCVNSVARIAEIKNTLSLPFFILSLWLYVRYEGISSAPEYKKQIEQNRWRDPAAILYGLSLISFVLALLSKTSTVMLPVVLLALMAWQHKRITRDDLLKVGPFFILALGFGMMSIWFQKHQALADAGQVLPPETYLERVAIAGRVVWFYLGKALLPLNLNLVYGRWKLDSSVLESILPAFLLCICFAISWRFRSGWGRHVLLGAFCFVATLFPVLGFFDSQFLATWQVSDHLQYLPLIAPVVLAASGIAILVNKKRFNFVGVLLIAVISILTFQRAKVFSSEEALFRDTLAKNPAASGAHNDLGVILAKRNDLINATRHFESAVQSDPENAGARLNFGQALSVTGKFPEAETQLLAAIKLKPTDSFAHKCFASILSQEGKNREAILHLKLALCYSASPDIQTHEDLASLLFQNGHFRQAADQFRKILLINSDLPESLNNLAWLLATCSDATVRNGAEAVRCAERACEMTAFKHPGMISTLAAAYAESGRFSEAVTNAESALRLLAMSGDTRLAGMSKELLRLYREGKPYHELAVDDRMAKD